jgi:hypothetical protein
MIACADAPVTLLQDDFTRNPLEAGWTVPTPRLGDGPAPVWAVAPGRPDERCLLIPDGYWESPVFPVAPFEYYCLQFSAKAEGDGYWAVFCFTADGEALAADEYATVEQSADWVDHTVIFQGRATARYARVRFQSVDRRTLCIDSVRVSAATRAEAVAWADAVYAGMPPVAYAPPADRWRYLPKTQAILRHGGILRIVLLGDSIANDTANSHFGVLLEQQYPGVRVEVVPSVRGSTGCEYYREAHRLHQYVYAYAPDLLIIGGISTKTPESVRAVIEQVRAAGSPAPDILVMSGAVSSNGYNPLTLADWSPVPRPQDGLRYTLMRLAEEQQAAYFDMAGAWGTYILQAGKPYDWFLRDSVHANVRGKQVLGRILARYFAP